MVIRHGPFLASAAAAVLAIGGAGTALALHTPGGRARIHAEVTSCGLVTCAALRSGVHSGGTVAIGAPVDTERSGGALPPTSATPVPSPASPAPAGSPQPAPSPVPRPTAPSPTPSPAPAGPAVTVTYSTIERWDGGFQGQLRIANNGSSPVNGWQIVITLSGDLVDTVWNADWQPGGGGSVTMTPASYDETIAPGSSVSVDFVAQGGTTQPGSCTFDGSACS